jgi:sugar phosphate isomerase/epimerase
MKISIFAKTFARPTLAATLDAVRAHGLDSVQFNLSSAGLPTLPDEISPEAVAGIRREMDARGLEMAALSGTFNMIHPDPEQREAGLRRLHVLAQACAGLGTGIITLCTGTRDPQDMWRRHPDNDLPEAWRDLTNSMSQALEIVGEAHVTLGVEPEVANVIDTAAKARRLLDEMQSPHLKIILDAANLFRAGDLARQRAVLNEAFDLLGPDIVLAHAKDLSRDGEAGHQAAGTGALDYVLYLKLLGQSGYTGPLILHSLTEAEVDPAIAFLRAKLGEVGAAEDRAK